MTSTTKKIFAYAPAALFWGIDFWAFSTGTYASEQDKVLPYLFAALSFLYMLPAVIAAHRDHSHFLGVWFVDLLGTPFFLIGWIAALIWAFIDPKETKMPRI